MRRSARPKTWPASISNIRFLNAKSTVNSTVQPPSPSGRKRQSLWRYFSGPSIYSTCTLSGRTFATLLVKVSRRPLNPTIMSASASSGVSLRTRIADTQGRNSG